MPDFTILSVLYGDHLDLAKRCISSIIRHINPDNAVDRLVIGMNGVHDKTRDYVHDLKSVHATKGLWNIDVYDAGDENRLKYPMMRQMLYDPDKPIRTPYVVWFDDDSYIAKTEVDLTSAWSEVMHGLDLDLLGSQYSMRLGGNQAAWVKTQPWYAGKPVPDKHIVRFCTGGWWIARYDTLKRFDYPWPELSHRGGDVMLGELCRQRDLRMLPIPGHLKGPIRINADAEGRESKSPRRGYDSKPIGWDYDATNLPTT